MPTRNVKDLSSDRAIAFVTEGLLQMLTSLKNVPNTPKETSESQMFKSPDRFAYPTNQFPWRAGNVCRPAFSRSTDFYENRPEENPCNADDVCLSFSRLSLSNHDSYKMCNFKLI